MIKITLPEAKRKTLQAIVDELKGVDHLTAIVLGGSHCTGLATEHSDLDLGLYYHEHAPFDIRQIRRIAAKHNLGDAPTVTDFYQWGAWVNGGAWFNTASGEVDFLHRNLEQVRSTIEKSQQGLWENDYEQQPPYGFSSTIYLAETYYCYPLYDPEGVIEAMKAEVANYPLPLKRTIVQQALWAAEFTLWQADKFAGKQDRYNAVGCFTRALKKMIDALFALNESYCMGDKSALQIIGHAPQCPVDLPAQIDAILRTDGEPLTANARKIRDLFEQVVTLAGELYKPYYTL